MGRFLDVSFNSLFSTFTRECVQDRSGGWGRECTSNSLAYSDSGTVTQLSNQATKKTRIIINATHIGDQTWCKSMVMLRDLPLIVHCLGWCHNIMTLTKQRYHQLPHHYPSWWSVGFFFLQIESLTNDTKTLEFPKEFRRCEAWKKFPSGISTGSRNWDHNLLNFLIWLMYREWVGSSSIFPGFHHGNQS